MAQQQTEQHSEGIPTIQRHGVSVNKRGGLSDGDIGKKLFLIVVFAVIAVGLVVAFSKWWAAKKEKSIQPEYNAPAEVPDRKQFDDSVQPTFEAPAEVEPDGDCDDGSHSVVMRGADGEMVLAANGEALRVCPDGQIIMPDIPPVVPAPEPVKEPEPEPLNRFRGGVILPSSGEGVIAGVTRQAGAVVSSEPGASSVSNATTQPSQNQAETPKPDSELAAYLLQQQQAQPPRDEPAESSSLNQMLAGAGIPVQNQQQSQQTYFGSVNASAQPTALRQPGGTSAVSTSVTSGVARVSATLLGDQNMILPKGKTIDCNLSIRLISDLAGMASCVLSQHVYSDNGKVVLLERGSEAVGRYAAEMSRGQRRLFVIWERIKTPHGVVIELQSPAAGPLGAMGMDGYIDDHWWERIGEAYMLSVVKDLIDYKLQQNSGNTIIFGETSDRTSDRFLDEMLRSTINIPPTLYKNQGDRGTIYVARDLDFSSVYALRPK